MASARARRIRALLAKAEGERAAKGVVNTRDRTATPARVIDMYEWLERHVERRKAGA